MTNEYWPFFVLAAFAAVVYAVTIIWTEYVSPDMEIESSEAETIEKPSSRQELLSQAYVNEAAAVVVGAFGSAVPTEHAE